MSKFSVDTGYIRGFCAATLLSTAWHASGTMRLTESRTFLTTDERDALCEPYRRAHDRRAFLDRAGWRYVTSASGQPLVFRDQLVGKPAAATESGNSGLPNPEALKALFQKRKR